MKKNSTADRLADRDRQFEVTVAEVMRFHKSRNGVARQVRP